MSKLLVYLKDYKRESVLGPFFKLLEALFELFVPIVMASIIDVGIAKRDTSHIYRMCGLMILLGIIGLVCSITAQYFAAKAATGFGTQLRNALFTHIQTLSFSKMDVVGTSTMITRMTSDINQVQSGVNLVLRLFLRSPFIVMGAMIMAFTIDVKAALIFVVIIPILSIVVFGIMFASIPLYKKVQGSLDRVLNTVRENLTGVRVIRAFAKEEQEMERFDHDNEELTKIQMYVGRISALMNPFTYIIINSGIIALVWVGALRVDGGYLTQGAIVALVNYMSQILVELIKLANLIISVNKAVACGNRVQDIFEIHSDIVDDAKEHEEREDAPAVTFDQVCLTYEGAGDESLHDINFKAMRGQTIGIIGGTGSGKSSLINLIPRFYEATKGEIRINGVSLKDYSIEELRAKIGVVLQKSVLFKGTIKENLLWGNESASDEELHEAIVKAQAKEFVEQKENGIDTLIEQSGRNLSGGQKQRLTIARALVRKPEILILDDSTSALDFATDAALREQLRKMSDQMTVFLVSQRASSIQYADQILVLDDGELVGSGTHEELLSNCSVYQEIYYSQFEKEVATNE
ncbi:lipid A export ATP-binding/permease protein MsbA [Lachnospiraceae bacterium KM106-2]|nr:lipid A export ATP-binding/permease protein MsbA [Lachnospiraceae bacterium KM106-2]